MKPTFTIVLLIALLASPAWSARPFTELEIPVPDLTGSHARALGMGGAHIAVAEDASAMMWNPAGLVRIRRIEVSASIARNEQNAETVWHGNPDEWGGMAAQLGSLHFLYPFPTYRGSLVIGFGIDRLLDYNLKYRRSGMDEARFPDPDPHDSSTPPVIDAWKMQSQESDGKLSAYSAAIAWDAGPRFSIGASLSYLKGSLYDRQVFYTKDIFDQDNGYAAQDSEYTPYDAIDDEYIMDMDLSGWTAMIGILYRASPRVRFGGVISAPKYIDAERYELVRFTDYYDNGTTYSDPTEYPFGPEETIRFPWWSGFGISYADHGVVLAADIRYTDWSSIQNKVNGREEFLKPYYRGATSYSVGGEALLPRIPIRIRAGYRYDPAPFHLTYWPLLDGDLPDESLGREPEEIDVSIDKERQVYSFGAGYLFGSVLTADVCYEMESMERVIDGSDPDLYRETRSNDRLLLTLGYRF